MSVLVRDLHARGVSVWFAPNNLQGGDKLNPVIRRALDSAQHVLVALSGPASNSPWVAKEVEYALSRIHSGADLRIIPLYLRSRDTLPALKDIKAIDLREYVYRAGLTELVETIQGVLPSGRTPLGSFEHFVESLPVVDEALYDEISRTLVASVVEPQFFTHGPERDARMAELKRIEQLKRIQQLLLQAGVPIHCVTDLLDPGGKSARRVAPVVRESQLTEIRTWLRIGTPVTRAIAASLFDFRLHSASGTIPSREWIISRPEQWVNRGEVSSPDLPDPDALLRQLAEQRLIRPYRSKRDGHIPVEAANQFLHGDWLLSVGRAAYLFDLLDPDRPSPHYPIGRYIS